MNPQVSVIRRNPVHDLHQREHGQTLLMFVLFMVALFLFAGLGIDLGFAYITRARLSKAVDSAALAAAHNAGQGTVSATTIADNAFHINYGTSGRDVSPPVPQVAFSNDVAGNLLVGVSATTTINTFFIRVLPTWSTLTVGSSATALRSKIVLSLVLDRSGSMAGNGGSGVLPGAVINFIDLFYEGYDRASMSSFASGATTDVPMEKNNFKTDIKNKANALVFANYTCSDGGMTNGLAQNAPVVINPGESVVKVIVFFTDGMANTFQYKFDCGLRDIIYSGPSLADPVTGGSANSGCTVPNELDSINPQTGAITPGVVDKTSCSDLHIEAQNRARRIAWMARNQGIIVYSIGMGSPGNPGECGGNQFPVLNPDFLKDVANTSDAPDYDSSKQQADFSGDYAIATDSTGLNEAFQTIAGKILLRLTR